MTAIVHIEVRDEFTAVKQFLLESEFSKYFLTVQCSQCSYQFNLSAVVNAVAVCEKQARNVTYVQVQ